MDDCACVCAEYVRKWHKDKFMNEKRYTIDVDDTAWLLIEPLVQQKPGQGRKRTVNIREVVNALFYLDHTGCNGRCSQNSFLIIVMSIIIT